MSATKQRQTLWSKQNKAWRAPRQVTSFWKEATALDPRLLEFKVRGPWWDLLAQMKSTLLVTREYEHLVMGLSTKQKAPHLTYMPLPHPSGLAVDFKKGVVYLASTRNPNQVYDLKPDADQKALVPVRSRFFPGSLYLHDLAVIKGQLYANAVGQNAVVRLHEEARAERVWWPHGMNDFSTNYLQLNSIAPGTSLRTSYFSASSDRMLDQRPGDLDYPVDQRGVVFSGATRKPMATGLTRPHSARLYKGKVWVLNSGYGEFGFIQKGRFEPVATLPGWTRGLTFFNNTALVGTSHVIKRFQQYAPGLDIHKSQCGLHMVDLKTGRIKASLIWPFGNQIFAMAAVPQSWVSGFPFNIKSTDQEEKEKSFFYSFKLKP